MLKDRSSALVSEANQCIGEETGFIGESTVTVTIDPSISQIPTRRISRADPLVTQPPTLSSPTK